MSLPIHQKQAIELLPKECVLYVSARFETEVISKLPVNKANEVVLSLITLCLQEAGVKDATDANVKVFLTQRTLEDCQKKFKQITVGELQIALNEGVRGAYGKYMGINVATINGWIKSFYDCETRKISLNYFNALLDTQKEKPEPTPEEKEKIFQRACIEAYDDFKNKGVMPFTFRVIYKYLKEKLKIEWTNEERQQIKDEATKNFEYELKAKKASREISKNQFEAALGEKKNLELEMVRVALLHYFRKLKNSNKEIIF